MLRVSVLDQSMIVQGRTPAAAIRETVDLARLCDTLGYHRYWVSEHHNTASVAGSAPEVLLGALALATTRIRIGAAGIMLPHYAALHVAEQFRVLEALAPGRVDLGLGRAPGSDGKTAFALNPDAMHAAETFPAQLRDVMAWSAGEPLAPGHPFADVTAHPAGPGAPEIWVLGSSEYGAQLAAHFGLPYCFAYFFAEGRGAREALQLYRARFRPSPRLAAPYAAICVFAVAADTEAEAARLFQAREVWRAERERGRYVALPTPEEAAAYPFSDEERRRNALLRARAFLGTPEQVRDRLHATAAELGADEIALVTATHDPDARRRSYAGIAEACGLRDAAHL